MNASDSTLMGALAVAAVAASGCTSPRQPNPSLSAGFGSGQESTGLSATGDGSSGGDSETEEPKLDFASTPDTSSVECVSISQTGVIGDRPSDIIMIADDDVDLELVSANFENLVPSIAVAGVFDARVVLVVGGDPPKDPEWVCPPFGFCEVVQSSVAPDRVLTDLLATHEQWGPYMRTHAWKHLFVTSTRSGDGSISNTDFLADFEMLVGAEVGTTVHALIPGKGPDDPNGYSGLTALTGGVYQTMDLEFQEYEEAVIERIMGTALACSYDIPDPPDGQIFDRDSVNVIYDYGVGPTPIGHVESANKCAAAGEAWFYDDPAAPTKVLMCPESCERFQELSIATIDIQFGCATIPAG